jgi:positive regulator of sigma E activity
MKETGKVIERKGDRIKVELPGRTACRTCSAGLFCRPRGDSRHVWVKDSSGARVGDTVDLELTEGRAILLSFLLFIVPLLLLVIVYGSLKLLLESELWAIVPALAVALAYFLLLRGSGASTSFMVRVVRHT